MGAISRTLNYLRRNGISAAFRAVCEELEKKKASRLYPYRYEPPARSVLEAQRLRAGALFAELKGAEQKDKPYFSVITPCYNTPPEFFLQLLESLSDQTWPYWELILADAGDDDTLEKLLQQWLAQKEGEEHPDLTLRSKLRYLRLAENGGISLNTNAGLREARGEYIALLDHDDLLTPDALFETARGIAFGKRAGKEYQVIFSDEDKCSFDRKMFHTPHQKEKFNLDLLLANNYICHFLVFKNKEKLHLLRKEYDGAQDYDLILRLTDGLGEQEILHIPRILYHWRISDTSSAENPKVKSYAYEAGRAVLQEYLQAHQMETADIEKLPHLGFYRVNYNGHLFSLREDVAMVGGPVWKGGRLANGISKDGAPLYRGLKKGFSGYMHRAVLQQDAYALHPGNLEMRPEIREEWKSFREELSRQGISEEESLVRFCRILRKRGYRLLYDPLFKAGQSPL